MAQKDIFNKLKRLAFMNIGAFLMAVGIYFFKAPNGFASGGVSGISIILAKLFPTLSQSVYMLIINVILLIVGVIVLGRGCGIKTIYCSLALSLISLLTIYSGLETFGMRTFIMQAAMTVVDNRTGYVVAIGGAVGDG